MTRTALPQLQQAVYSLLTVTPNVTSLITAVYDAVPETPAPVFPYIVLDDPFETPHRTFGQDGHEQVVLVSIYTRDGSTTAGGKGTAGFRTGLLIAEQVITALMDGPFTVVDHDVADVDVMSVEAFREPDGITRRVDVTMTMIVEDAVVAT